MASESVEHGLIVAFPDQSESFVLGYEAGMLWARMEDGHHAEIEATTHEANRDVIDRMAVALGWLVERELSVVDGWDRTVLHKNSAPPVRPNPRGFRIVGGSHD